MPRNHSRVTQPDLDPVTRIAADYVADIMAVQSEMLKRLSERAPLSLPEIGNLTEDIGNLYLNISDAISRRLRRHDTQGASQQLSFGKIRTEF